MKQLSTYICEDFKISKNIKISKRNKNSFLFHKSSDTKLTIIITDFSYINDDFIYYINDMDDDELNDFLQKNDKWDLSGIIHIHIDIKGYNKNSFMDISVKHNNKGVHFVDNTSTIVNSHDLAEYDFYDIFSIATNMYIDNYIDTLEKSGVDIMDNLKDYIVSM